ncbi:DUF805 domain-containing protein [Selenomonadales bacterium OttesenSCG-928-I06]|nr:DUF805 domain-containing protein [Selenomonadales bacterium OttesenSCG-928-I06]
MNFSEINSDKIKKEIKKYFEGRLNRKPYVIKSLVLWVVIATIYMVITAYKGLDGMALANLLTLPLLIVAVSLTVRRLHDLNFSGWWALLLIVFSASPVIQYVVFGMLGVLFVMKGTIGNNLYGKDPLESEE